LGQSDALASPRDRIST